MSRLLFAAGGTGGHVFPALAIAKAARAMNPQTEILFVGTEKGFEAKLVPQAGYTIEFVKVSGLKNRGIWARVNAIALLPGAFWRSWKILRSFSPTSVFGIGGYASGPIMLLAAFSKAKTAILEPNSTPGFSNRLLATFVDRVYVAFEAAMNRLPKKKCVYSGNPIREDILGVSPPTFVGAVKTVLVFGGSQGAKRLNEAVTAALPKLEKIKKEITFVHQTGDKDVEWVRSAYAKAGFNAEVSPFIQEMAQAFNRSDVVIARSGSSVLEIAACGRPSILVPYPSAADDHQEANARVMEQAGAAIYIHDSQCTGEAIADAITSLIEQPSRLKVMSEKALSLRKSQSAELIAKEMMEMAA